MGCNIVAVAKDKSAHCIVNRPRWKDTLRFYQYLADNLSTHELFVELFGEDYNRDKFGNSCAARVSLALLSAGVNNVGSDYRATHGKFIGTGVTVSAEGMRKLLAKMWGKPEVPIFKTNSTTTLDDLKREIEGRKGVFSFLSSDRKDFGASGHITLWDGNGVISGRKYLNHAYANGNVGDVCLWELK